MDPITAIGIVGTLAAAVVDIWLRVGDSRQRKLDQEYRLELTHARREHAELLRQFRMTQPYREPSFTSDEGLIARLSMEAEYLTAMNCDVAFEVVGKGYGLALPMSKKAVLVFWISTDYPSQAPLVLIWESSSIDRIEFDEGAWAPDRTLAEIYAIISPIYQEQNDKRGRRAGAGKIQGNLST